LLAPERVYLQLISASPIPSGEKGLQTLGQLATRSDVAGVVTSAAQLMGKPSRPYFRVTCRRSGTKSFGTDAAAAAIASGLEALHWQPDLQRFDTEILAWIHSDRLLLGLSVSARGVVGGAHLLVPGRQVSTSPLRPHIAYAMLVKCAGSSTDSGVVLDPMCGSNVIAELATGSEMAPRLFCLSGDFGESAIVSARINAEKLLCSRRARIDIVRWDARRLPLRRFSVDWVVVHPPGVRFFGPRHLAELYESAFSECRRVLRPRRREKGSSSVTAALLVNRKLAAGPLSGMVAGDAGCGLQGGAMGIAWVRHGEVRLPHEGDSALVSLETRVKPVPKVKLRAAESKQE